MASNSPATQHISHEGREQLVADARELNLTIIAKGGETCRSHAGSSGTMIAGRTEGDLRRLVALAGLDIESNCPYPLDVFHRSPNPRRATRVGGDRKSWAGLITPFAGETIDKPNAHYLLHVFGTTF